MFASEPKATDGIAAIDVLATFASSISRRSDLVALDDVQKIAAKHYDLNASVQRLPGEQNQNFRLTSNDGRNFVLKVSPSTEDPSIIDLANAALFRVQQRLPQFPSSQLIPNRNGEYVSNVRVSGRTTLPMRLLSWVPGKPLAVSARSALQRRTCGFLAASLGRALRGFEHPRARRFVVRDLRQLSHLMSFWPEIPSLAHSDFVAKFFEHYVRHIEPRLAQCRRQLVHNDLTAKNIMVDPADDSSIAGIIDFGDVVETALIADVATAAAAHVTDIHSIERDVAEFLHAYDAVEALRRNEWELVNWLIAARKMCDLIIPLWYITKTNTGGRWQSTTSASVENQLDRIAALAGLRFGSRASTIGTRLRTAALRQSDARI